MGLNPSLDHLAVVTAARQKYDTLPPGPERAWRVLNETCLRLQALGEDAGLLEKTIGTQHLGCSIDVLIYRDGTAVDALRDAEGAAEPQWSVIAPLDPARWRPPLGDVPETEPPPVTPPPVDPPPTSECGMCRDCLEVLKAELASANEQRQVVIQILAKLATLDELRGLVGELRQAPLPVKMRW